MMKVYKVFLSVVSAIIIPFLANAQDMGVSSPKVVFSEKSQVFLSVYSVRNTGNDGVFGVLINRRGEANSPFKIVESNPGDVDLAYISNGDRFLVVYIDKTNGFSITGRLIGSDGKFLSDIISISSNSFGISNLKVVPAVDGNSFLVMWLDNRTRMGTQLYARFVLSDGSLSNEILVESDASSIVRFDISTDVDNGNYLMTYVDNLQMPYFTVIYGKLFDSGFKSSGEIKIAESYDIDSHLSVTYNRNQQRYMVVWSDFTAGSNSYNIKGAILNNNATTLLNLDITNDTSSSRFPDVSYNIYSRNYAVAYKTSKPQAGTSNINVTYISENGQVKGVVSVDDTNTLFLNNPSIASNGFCGNEVVVYENYDVNNKQNLFSMKLLGDLCRFKLSVSKKGDGDGVVSSNPAGIDCGDKCSALFDDGTKVTISALPLESSLFSSFTGMECVNEPVCTINMDSDKYIEVEFLLKTFNITTSAGQGGRIQPESAKVEYGGEQRFDIIPDNGYVVENVIVDDLYPQGPVTTYTFTNVTSPHTLSATFKQTNVYTIHASASEGGTIYPSGEVTVSAGESITFTITASNGYYLSAVEVDGMDIGRVNQYTFEDVQSDHTIFAKFEADLNEDGGKEVFQGNEGVTTTVVNQREESSGCSCDLIE